MESLLKRCSRGAGSQCERIEMYFVVSLVTVISFLMPTELYAESHDSSVQSIIALGERGGKKVRRIGTAEYGNFDGAILEGERQCQLQGRGKRKVRAYGEVHRTSTSGHGPAGNTKRRAHHLPAKEKI